MSDHTIVIIRLMKIFFVQFFCVFLPSVWPRATQRPRPGVVPEARGDGREEQPHAQGQGGNREEQHDAQGVVAVQAQEGLEEPFQTEDQEG